MPVLLADTNLALPGCISKCGEVSVPYPFGVGVGCYHKGFELTCNETYNPPKLILEGAEVLYISLRHGKVFVDNGIVRLTGSNAYNITWGIPLDDSIFTVSPFWNNFVVMGCGFEFLVSPADVDNMVVRCTSSCLLGRPAVATNGFCSGVGCCEASMPGAGNMYSIKLASYPAGNDLTMQGQPFNATLVMVDSEWWGTGNNSLSLQKAVSDALVTSRGISGSAGPVQAKAVVKWNFSNSSCTDARSSSDYGCLSYNSHCHDHWTGESSGYICRCSDGYEGNPYILNGCQGLAVATGFGTGACLLLLTFAAILLRRKLRARKAKRDIKATNILLDDNLTAKVSDFGASRGIPIDETRVTTAIQGTFGYLDPECYKTRQLTEKSDVYSFGVMLVELLTRQKPHIYMSPAGNSLVEQFLLLQKQNKLSEILDPQVAKEGDEDAREVAEVAAMCVSSSGEDRPTMKQVEMRLEALQSASTNIAEDPRAGEHAVSIPSAGRRSSNADGSRRFSMEREILLSMDFPR
nr:unnamed protein product [Digitaria exilis]